MNPSLVSASSLFAPVGRFLRKLHGQRDGRLPIAQPAGGPSAATGCVRMSPLRRAVSPAASQPGARGQRLPLRVVRVMEAGQASALAGRILMSGRMADVCAELDRMVEREAAFQSAV